MHFNTPQSAIEWISWTLTVCALCAGVIMRTSWIDVEIVRTAGLIVGLTTTVNQFLLNNRIKHARNGQKNEQKNQSKN
jgi:hypothetical protein